MRNSTRNIIAGLVLTTSLLTTAVSQAAFIWIEGENVLKSNMPQNPWMKGDNPQLLSGGDAFAGLTKASELPSPCFILYKVTAPEDGNYFFYMHQSWLGHMGKTRVRFVKLGADDKPVKKPDAEEGWRELDLDVPMMDLTSIGANRHIAWVKYDQFKLEKGTYLLDMQVLGPNPGHTDANPPIWMMIDVICLTTEPFTPHGTLKPGEKPDATKKSGATDYY